MIGSTRWLLLGTMGCVPTPNRIAVPGEDTGASSVARVDLERLRGGSAIGRAAKAADAARGLDAELSIRLTAVVVAEHAGFLAVVDEHGAVIAGQPWGSAAPIDLTLRVLATLDHPPLADFAWLIGPWQGEANGTTTSELWCPTAYGGLLGLNRTLVDGREVAFEYLAIAEEAGAAVYLARPGGRTPAVRFPRRPVTAPLAAEFADPTHDFPSLLRYGRVGAALEVTASGSASPTLTWRWQRAMGGGVLDELAKVPAAVPELGEECAALARRVSIEGTRTASRQRDAAELR